MGSCCVKSKDVQELEDELGTLLNEKRKLEEKLSKQELVQQGKYSPPVPEIFKFIDHDQYTSLKIIETFYSILPADTELFHSISLKSQNLSKLENDAKLIQYGEVRKEETELQKKLVHTCYDHYKELLSLANQKETQAESRFDRIQSVLINSKSNLQNRKSIQENLNLLKTFKPDFSSTISKLKKLELIEEDLSQIEKSLPGLHEDSILRQIKNLEIFLSDLGKSSLASTQNLETIFGQLNIPATLDASALKVVDIDRTTLDDMFKSIFKYLNNLQELEVFKGQVLQFNSINEKLQAIDRTLTKHFMSSEQSKETAYSRINRVSRSQSDFSFSSHMEFLQYELGEKSVPDTIKILKQKAKKYLKSLEEQDKNLLEMTEKFNLIDKIIDEIELKFQEYITFEIKELHKWIHNADKKVKDQLEDLNDRVIQYEETRTQEDLITRLTKFQNKFILTDTLNEIKSALKETYMKELNKVKIEYHEKVNELNSQLSESKNSIVIIDTNYQTTKLQLSRTKEMTEDLLKQNSEKDLEVAGLRNKFHSVKEEFEQVRQERDQILEEVEELRKEVKECKKNLRAKEHELQELKESKDN